LLVDYSEIAKHMHVKVGWESHCPSFWKELKPARQGILAIHFCMIVGTVWLLTGVAMQAKFEFEVVRMEFLFFPAMAKWAAILKRTAILV
jgi:hypothetical protein